jgi:hypothetical protein
MSLVQRSLSVLLRAGPLVALVIVGCGDAPASNESAPTTAGGIAAAELPRYETLRDSVVDAPDRTVVERHLIVQDSAENGAIEALLRAEFAAIMGSGPYTYREQPSHVYIRVYDSEVRSRRPARWRAMLRFGPGADEPAVQTENPTLERHLDG